MAEERAKRKLAAILSADVKGYSRLMEDDEEATVRTITAYRGLMVSRIQNHDGRVVDAKGDNLLAEFSSVVNAVRCAVEIQKDLRKENSQLPEDRKMEFRIGVNLGDVIEKGETIYGDGVNIAARMESLAEGGGVCVSGTAYDQLEGKMPFVFEYLGEQPVKNIKKAVRVYRLLIEPEVVPPTSVEISLPDEPSIAVLPFVNMSGDHEQEYFSDGMTDDLITDLCKISGLFVIARNSVFAYKGKAVKVQEVGRELGVRFLLEGSVRKAGKRIRINAQLIDVVTGGHVWAERFDRELGDIFDLQDEVTREIVAALALNLTKREQDRLARRETSNVTAYDCVLRGMESHYRHTREGNEQSKALFQKAIDLDPAYAMAYAWLGFALLHGWVQGWTRDFQFLPRAFELAQKAISLNDSLPEAHRILGDLYLYGAKDHDKAVSEFRSAIILNASYADALAGLADALAWAGRPEEAMASVSKAMRLNPHHHAWYFHPLGLSYMICGRWVEAVETYKRGAARNPDFLGHHLALAGLYAQQGREEEARAEVMEVLRISPQYSLDLFRQMVPAKDPETREQMLDLLSKAGLP
jgi:adenylate cyclase